MRVFIYLNELARHFGPGIQAVLLATELERRGVSVVVFVEQGVASGNQYLSMLRSRGVRVVVPGLWALRIARYLSLPRLVLTLLIPLRLLLTVLDMLLHQRSMRRSWQGVRGRLNRYLPVSSRPLILRWLLFYRMSRENRREAADLVHSFTGVGSVFEWAHKNRVPIVYNENIVPSDRFGVDWWRDVKRHASKVGLMVSVCHAAEQSIRDFLQYRGPIAVIPCMVADPLVNSVDPGSQSSMRNGRVVLGTAARLDAEKGHRVLLQAIFIVNKQLGEQMPEFWIAGDGPERERLEVLGRELQVCSNIRFLGYCGSDEMETFWRSIDILVLPSLWEGLPNVILEAMAHGQPVIATRVGGVPEAVLDNVTGIVVQPGNADHLAQAIIRLTVDGSLRASMGRAGRTRYEKLYRPELVVRRYLSAYESVASKER